MAWDFDAEWDSPMDPDEVMARDRARNKQFEQRGFGDCPLPGNYTPSEKKDGTGSEVSG